MTEVKMKNLNEIPDVIVEVRGGNVIQVYVKSQETNVIVIDWDKVTPGRPQGHIAELKPLLLAQMPSDTEAAIASRCTAPI